MSESRCTTPRHGGDNRILAPMGKPSNANAFSHSEISLEVSPSSSLAEQR